MQPDFIATPCIDNHFMDDTPLNLIKRQEFHKVPLMLGTNTDEGTLMVVSLYPGYAARKDPPFIKEDVFRNVSFIKDLFCFVFGG